MPNERDMFTRRTDGYVELVRDKMHGRKQFAVCEAAELFEVCETVIRDWILEGRLLAADLNKDRDSRANPGQPMRPLYKITHEAVIDLARRVQGGY